MLYVARDHGEHGHERTFLKGHQTVAVGGGTLSKDTKRSEKLPFINIILPFHNLRNTFIPFFSCTAAFGKIHCIESVIKLSSDRPVFDCFFGCEARRVW